MHNNDSDNHSSSDSEDIPSDVVENDISSDNLMNMKSSSSSSTIIVKKGFTTFCCDEPGCIKQYFRFSNLVNHHARGDHLFKPDKIRIRDKAIQLFKNGVEQVKPHQSQQLHNFKILSSASTSSSDEESDIDDEESGSDDDTEIVTHELQKGWALKESRNVTRFSNKQISYLNEKFEEGKKNGSKWNPNAVFEVSCANFLFMYEHYLL